MKRKIFQKKKKEQSSSIVMKEVNSALSPEKVDNTQSRIVLLQKCSEITIKKFKQAYCLDDLSVLIIEGSPTRDQLEIAWNNIVTEYADTIKNDDSEYVFDLGKEIGLLQHHIIYVEEAVKYLRRRFNIDMFNELILIGYEFLIETEDVVEWNKQLNRVISLCKTKIFDLEELQNQYNRIEKTTGNKKMSEDDFNKNVAMLSKYQGYKIDQSLTMMDEYISIFNNLLYENNLMKKK